MPHYAFRPRLSHDSHIVVGLANRYELWLEWTQALWALLGQNGNTGDPVRFRTMRLISAAASNKGKTAEGRCRKP
jgi:hypothetical protein